MTPAITLDEARAIFSGEVDAGWLAELTSTEEGQAMLDAALDMFVEVDRRSLANAGASFVDSATRSNRATVGLLFRRTRAGEPLRIPSGTLVESSDGVRFVLDDDVLLPEGAVNVDVDTTATAEVDGDVGVFPAGTIDRFSPVLETLSGAGTELAVVADGPFLRVRITTDVTQPSPFRQSMLGLYITIADDDGSHAGNLGRLVRVVSVNAGVAPTLPGALEDTTAWSAAFAPTSREVVGFDPDEYLFTWRVVPWSELGVTVRNPAAASLGTGPSLDALALLRGMPPFDGADGTREPDEDLRRRLRLAPQGPTPLGLLRKALQAAVPFGQDITKLRIYEPGAVAPDGDQDPYAAQFPAYGGFYLDFHALDQLSADTPAALLTVGMYGLSYSGGADPGPAFPFDGCETRVLIRWDETGVAEPQAQVIRAALLAAADDAKPPGVVVDLYQSQLHGFPNP